MVKGFSTYCTIITKFFFVKDKDYRKKHLAGWILLLLLQALITGFNIFEMSKKQLYTLEFKVRCSPNILWDFLSSTTGLQEWFADKIDIWEDVWSFSWGDGEPDKAKVVDQEENKFIRYRWLHMDKAEYFEFRIAKTEISSQTILIITDFAEKSEIKDASQLWEYQTKELFHRLGS